MNKDYELTKLKAYASVLRDVQREYSGYRTLSNIIDNINARIRTLEKWRADDDGAAVQ